MKRYLCLLLALTMLLLVGCQNKKEEPEGSQGIGATAPDLIDTDLAEKIAATAGDYQLNNAMMAFFFYDALHAFVTENYYYLSSYGLDLNKSLKEQTIPQSEMTWFDYFVSQAKSEVTQMLVFAAYATENGITISESDSAAIVESMAAVKEYAAENDFETIDHYYATYYCNGVTEEVVRNCMELRYLALTAYESLNDSYTFSDEDLMAYVTENPMNFYYFDYQYFIFYPEYDEDATEEEIKAAYEAVQAEATAFAADAAVSGEEAFVTALRTEKDCDEETAKQYLDEQYTMKNSIFYEGKDFVLWALEEERQIGDVKMSWSEENEVAIVYRMLSRGEFQEECYKDVRHILFKFDQYESNEAAKAEAERVLALYEAGEKTAEAFGALAKEYTDDGNGDVGGLYEDVYPGQMVEPFENWLFDDSRVEGDVGIVETTFGYHIMYFAGNGEVIWKTSADEALRSEKLLEDYMALLETYAVTYNDEIISEIA